MSGDRPTEDLPAGGAAAADAARPPSVGNYRPLELIGEGGFGEVWKAEQVRPVRRTVALKVIKAGMDSRQVIARFESERQALAMMDHPYIAKVLEAGTTEFGRPYFAMEYVPGTWITHYADREKLTTRERLGLFSQVCEGVQHAHHKAVIHRDIKPSNILVAATDDRPLPKIIDFGVAKAIAQPLTDKTLVTQLGHFVGTPEYMSPEQAAGTHEGVDTRTDVYSLGVVLYELLVGALPIDSRELRKAGADEIRRKIREDDPRRPSTRVSTLGDASMDTATRRRTDPPSLARQLKGDLDWIVMKALEKERARRYATPGDLAADIQRHLADEPVLAGPPSAVYRIGKLVRRHRLAAAAASVTLLALVVGLVLAGWGMMRATRAEAEARQEAATARQVSSFMVDLFEGSDPGNARGAEITAREILDRGVQRIETELADQPAVQSELMETMGRVYHILGLYDDARPLLEEAVAIQDRDPEKNPALLAAALNELAWVHLWQGNYDESETAARRSLEIREALYGPEHADVATSLNTLGNAYQNKGELEQAEITHRRAVAVQEALGVDGRDLARNLHNLAITRYAQNDFAEAEQLYKRAAEIEERTGGVDNYRLATSLHTLAMLYQELGRYDEAIPIEKRSLEIREKVLGPEHPHVSYSLTTLGNLYRDTDRPAEAEPLLHRAVEIATRAWNPLYPEVRWMRRNLARSIAEQGRVGEAVNLLSELLVAGEEAGDEDSLTPTLNAMGDVYAANRRPDDAERAYARSLEIEERFYGADSQYLVPPLQGLANIHRSRGNHSEARPLYERALSILDNAGDSESADRVALLNDYLVSLTDAGDLERAASVRAKIPSTPR